MIQILTQPFWRGLNCQIWYENQDLIPFIRIFKINVLKIIVLYMPYLNIKIWINYDAFSV